MKTKGINKDLDNYKPEYGTQEYYEKCLKEMINSCFAYDDVEMNGYSYKRYILPYKANLSDEVFYEVYNEQYTYLKTKCIVQHGVHTDFEGCTYNSIVEIR